MQFKIESVMIFFVLYMTLGEHFPRKSNIQITRRHQEISHVPRLLDVIVYVVETVRR